MNEKESNASNASTLLQSVLKVLQNVTIERAQKSRANKLQKKKLDGEEDEADIKIHIHLVNTLRSCLKRGYDGEAYEIFKFLVDNAQCSRNFIWKMLMIFTEKDKSSLQLVSNMANHFLQLRAGFASEVQLVRLISLVKQELYSKASFETPKEAKRLKFSEDGASYPAVGSSLLLTGYHTLLQYQNVEDGDFTMLEGMAKSFQELFKCKVFYPLFIEAYTLVLLKLEQDENARQLLYSYVDLESKCNAGVLGAVHAFNIVKLHMRDGAGEKLLFHLLENIAERSPGHPRVLDLCRLLLDKRSIRSGKKDNELYTDAESGESEDVSKRLDYKKACVDKSLKLMFDFLDTYAYHEPSDIVKQAWCLMADILRRIFTDEEMTFLHTIVNYWHKNRKHWWPFFQVKKNISIKPGEATLLSNQAFVCYVFEEEGHPFVQSVLSLSTSSLLSSLISQLRDQKSIFDEKMQRILLENPPKERVRLQSKPKMPINSTSTIQNEETVTYETLKHIDSAELASEYLRFRCRTKSIRPKNDYSTTAFITPAIQECLSLPIEDLVRKRFERRRKLPPRKHIVNPPLAVLHPSDSEDSQDAELDDFRKSEQSDSTSVDEFEVPRISWVGRLRKHGAPEKDAPDSDGEELFVPKKAPIPREVKMKAQRWNRFLERGRWFTLANDRKTGLQRYDDLSSDDEYVPGAEFSSSSESDNNKLTAKERYLARRKPKTFVYPKLATSSSISSSSDSSRNSKSRYSPSPKSRSDYARSRYSPSKADKLAALQSQLGNSPSSLSSSSSDTSSSSESSLPNSPNPQSLSQYQRSRYSGSSRELTSSRASSSLPLYTPDLQFSDGGPKPSQVISNEEHYRFFDHDSFSVCSSTTEDIAQSISKVMKKLELEDCPSGVTLDSTRNDLENEYVVEAELPEPHKESFSQSVGTLTARVQNGRHLSQEQSNDPTGFSRECDASSPDMFVSCSENEGDSAAVAKQQKPQEEIPESQKSARQNTHVVSSLGKTGTLESPVGTSTPISLSQVNKRQSKRNERATLFDNVKSLPTKEKVDQKSANQKKSKSKNSQIGDCVQTMDSKDECESTTVVDTSTATPSKGKGGKLSSLVKSTDVNRVRKLSYNASLGPNSSKANTKKTKITLPELDSGRQQLMAELEASRTPTPMSGLSDGSLSRTVLSKAQPKDKGTTQEGEALSSCSLSLVLELEASQKDSYREDTANKSKAPSVTRKSVGSNASQITSNAINDSKSATSNSSQSRAKTKACVRDPYSWSEQEKNSESFDLPKKKQNTAQKTPTKTQKTKRSLNSDDVSELSLANESGYGTPKQGQTPKKGETVGTRKTFMLTQPITGLDDSHTSKSSSKNKQSKASDAWNLTSTVADTSASSSVTSTSVVNQVDVDKLVESILNKSDENLPNLSTSNIDTIRLSRHGSPIVEELDVHKSSTKSTRRSVSRSPKIAVENTGTRKEIEQQPSPRRSPAKKPIPGTPDRPIDKIIAEEKEAAVKSTPKVNKLSLSKRCKSVFSDQDKEKLGSPKKSHTVETTGEPDNRSIEKSDKAVLVSTTNPRSPSKTGKSALSKRGNEVLNSPNKSKVVEVTKQLELQVEGKIISDEGVGGSDVESAAEISQPSVEKCPKGNLKKSKKEKKKKQVSPKAIPTLETSSQAAKVGAAESDSTDAESLIQSILKETTASLKKKKKNKHKESRNENETRESLTVSHSEVSKKKKKKKRQSDADISKSDQVVDKSKKASEEANTRKEKEDHQETPRVTLKRKKNSDTSRQLVTKQRDEVSVSDTEDVELLIQNIINETKESLTGSHKKKSKKKKKQLSESGTSKADQVAETTDDTPNKSAAKVNRLSVSKRPVNDLSKSGKAKELQQATPLHSTKGNTLFATPEHRVSVNSKLSTGKKSSSLSNKLSEKKRQETHPHQGSSNENQVVETAAKVPGTSSAAIVKSASKKDKLPSKHKSSIDKEIWKTPHSTPVGSAKKSKIAETPQQRRVDGEEPSPKMVGSVSKPLKRKTSQLVTPLTSPKKAKKTDKPVSMSLAIEEVMKKYMGSSSSDSSDNEAASKSKRIDDKSKSCPVKKSDRFSPGTSSGGSAKQSVKRKIFEGSDSSRDRLEPNRSGKKKKKTAARRSLIDQRNMDLIDQLLKGHCSSSSGSDSPLPDRSTPKKLLKVLDSESSECGQSGLSSSKQKKNK